MPNNQVTQESVLALRQFTGSVLKDSKLRGFLVRHGGDLNAAASALLLETATRPSAAHVVDNSTQQLQPTTDSLSKPEALTSTAPTPDSYHQNHSSSVAPVPTKPSSSRAEIRRLAWSRFFKEHYRHALENVGSDTNRINKFIAELWRNLGSEKRKQYTHLAASSVTSPDTRSRTSSATPAAAATNSPELPSRSPAKNTPLRAPSTSASGQASGKNSTAVNRHESSQSDIKIPGLEERSTELSHHDTREVPLAQQQPQLVCRDETVSPALSHQQSCAHHCHQEKSKVKMAPEVSLEVEERGNDTLPTDEDDVEWPKKIDSRLCVGTILAFGKNRLTASEELTLDCPVIKVPKRAGKVRSKDAMSHASHPKVVRFYKDGRELGRLSQDVGNPLAPALQSGYVFATCKVVSAPPVLRTFSEVVLEVTIFLRKEAFQRFANGRDVEAGLQEDDEGNSCSNKSQGVDQECMNVVHMISSLGLCEPPVEGGEIDAPPSERSAGGEPGSISEQDTESYYRSVDAIDEAEAKDFVPSKYLTCTLREYQKVGVKWMIAREKHGNLAQLSDPTSMDVVFNPLWRKKRFPDGNMFFMNTTTGQLSLTPPAGSKGGPYGGILADEMGLGKTVQCIACIVHDMGDQVVHSRSFNNGHVTNRTTQDSIKQDKEIPSDPTGDCSQAQHTPHQKEKDVVNGDSEVVTDETLSPHASADHEELSQTHKRRRVSRSHSSRPGKRKRYAEFKKSPDGDEQSSQEDNKEKDADWVEAISDDNGGKDSLSSKHNDSAAITDSDNNDFVEATSKGSRRHKKNEQSALQLLMSKANTRNSGKGGSLIVCPTSLVTQWMNELSLHVAPNFLRAVTHYGQSRGEAQSISLEHADVVVTTYGILASEIPEKCEEGEEQSSRKGGPIFQLHWRRIILDEAHTIKGRVTRWAKACYMIDADKRWCVTGTVIHNHINDVFSLLHFLRLQPWSSWAFWNRGIVNNLESKDAGSQKAAMSLVRDIISSVTLRRKKSTKDSEGKAIVQLTKKDVEIVSLTPSEEERDFYASLHKESKRRFDTFVAQGKALANYASVLELLLRLRQACDHPYLVTAAAPSKDSALLKDRDKIYKKFVNSGSSQGFVENILKEAEAGMLSRECPLCLDIIDDAVAPQECGHPACRSCLMTAVRRSQKCPVCRVPIRFTSITTLPRQTRFSVDLKTKWRSSAKIDALLKEVQERHSTRVAQGKAIGKTVIFSQFTSMLDLVDMALGKENFCTMRIDGSVAQPKRASILKCFEDEDELEPGTANILLVSLRAGGVGLNLVSANHAILLDIHWNPQVDAQAQDRIHRHGQTRDVLIRRYIIKDSVEEKLLQVQARKQDIADGALGAPTDEDRKQARLSELKLLFSGS